MLRVTATMLVFLAMLTGAFSVSAQENMDPRDAFSRGAELAQAGDHAAAIPYFERAAEAYPYHQGVLWNLGVSNAAVGNDQRALDYWQLYGEHHPDDWRWRAKIIQAYQALGDLPDRDRERRALFEARKEAPEGSVLRQETKYCREQMTVAGKRVLVFEDFEPAEDWAVFYRFVVLDDQGRQASVLSLGSYQATNEIMWETGQLARDKRLYHLDRYEGDTHSTYAFFEEMPEYDSVRARVIEILSSP